MRIIKNRDKGKKNILMRLRSILILIIILGLTACKKKDKAPRIDPVAALFSKTTVAVEIEYRNINGISLALDVYVPSKRLGESPWVKYAEEKKPVLLYLHGGGWRSGEKESRILEFLPYVDRGWVVVTANYRLLHQASLPEIIGDCRTTLDWVYNQSDKFKIDTNKIVVTGNSAGGHLALMTALVKEDTLYRSDPSLHKKSRVAGVINWYGITDVSLFVNNWKDKEIIFGEKYEVDSISKITSPIYNIDKNAPPVLTIHGANDKVVPFIHAEMLHQELNEHGIKNKLLKIENRKHGDFDAEEMTQIYKEIWKFLDAIGINNQYYDISK